MIISIRSKNKLELFIMNWSYSYDKKMNFATYQRMRAKGASWDGPSQILNLKNSGQVLKNNVKGPIDSVYWTEIYVYL